MFAFLALFLFLALLLVVLPTDLPAFVLLFEPGHQRLEIVHHRAGRKIFAGRLFEHFAPVLRASLLQNAVKPFSDFLVAGVVTRLGRLMENFARDVIV